MALKGANCETLTNRAPLCYYDFTFIPAQDLTNRNPL
ncbi:hypothetical protein OCOJLMKI_2613 [Methylobacterium iners]|uniref:Uncharacterized protein n=1 Tax=Methylobacterium iners TaxID=418707 RepID=A0ABQ4RXV0_9HYPH|nr:hypothetical protein OCOJLMKI_2613 [Methylobacterium iners]